MLTETRLGKAGYLVRQWSPSSRPLPCSAPGLTAVLAGEEPSKVVRIA
jgi:hypothetical protein